MIHQKRVSRKDAKISKVAEAKTRNGSLLVTIDSHGVCCK